MKRVHDQKSLRSMLRLAESRHLQATARLTENLIKVSAAEHEIRLLNQAGIDATNAASVQNAESRRQFLRSELEMLSAQNELLIPSANRRLTEFNVVQKLYKNACREEKRERERRLHFLPDDISN